MNMYLVLGLFESMIKASRNEWIAHLEYYPIGVGSGEFNFAFDALIAMGSD